MLPSSSTPSLNPYPTGKGCISYLLNSDGESLIIDPVYPIDEYIQKASEIESKISRIIDTHQHADHVSAAKELSQQTGALYYQSKYENYSNGGKGDIQIRDGDIINVGKIKVKAIYTPGHTQGSISFLIEGDANKKNNTKLLFTGDTLFVNGIGRPDLSDKAKEFSSQLYDTLHNKLFILDDVIVFPAHFDKDIGSEKILSSKIGEIKKKVIL
jgi:glyoxylase-like metal-dependent hydrolase (beta-lactamase superfamily II)